MTKNMIRATKSCPYKNKERDLVWQNQREITMKF